MSTILLLGKNGMLGQAIEALLHESPKQEASQNDWHSISWGRQDLDVADASAVHTKITALKPAVVINATGYTDVDGAEEHKETAFAINAEAVNGIAKVCREIGALFIHFSTDYVFNGTAKKGYTEDDTTHSGPLNRYGASKLKGEEYIADVFTKTQLTAQPKGEAGKARYFILRTSWLYGPGGKNFVASMLKRARDGQQEFKVVDDQFGKPTFTNDLAHMVLQVINNRDAFDSGIYHTTNETKEGGISWYEFTQEIFKQAHRRSLIKTIPRVIPCKSTEFPRPAKRPAYGALINTKLPALPDWKKALNRYLGVV